MPLVSDTAAAFESASVCSCCLISEAANLGTEGVFTLSAPNTLVLYSFVLGKQEKKKQQKKKERSAVCASTCVCVYIVWETETKLSKCGRVRTFIVQQTDGTKYAAFVVS